MKVNMPTDRFEDAFRHLSRAIDRPTSLEASYALLDAVGNNHAGSFHELAFELIPALDTFLRDGGPWVRFAVLEALIDLGSFEWYPEEASGMTTAEAKQKLVDLTRQLLRNTSLHAGLPGPGDESLVTLLAIIESRDPRV